MIVTVTLFEIRKNRPHIREGLIITPLNKLLKLNRTLNIRMQYAG